MKAKVRELLLLLLLLFTCDQNIVCHPSKPQDLGMPALKPLTLKPSRSISESSRALVTRDEERSNLDEFLERVKYLLKHCFTNAGVTCFLR